MARTDGDRHRPAAGLRRGRSRLGGGNKGDGEIEAGAVAGGVGHAVAERAVGGQTHGRAAELAAGGVEAHAGRRREPIAVGRAPAHGGGQDDGAGRLAQGERAVAHIGDEAQLPAGRGRRPGQPELGGRHRAAFVVGVELGAVDRRDGVPVEADVDELLVGQVEPAPLALVAVGEELPDLGIALEVDEAAVRPALDLVGAHIADRLPIEAVALEDGRVEQKPLEALAVGDAAEEDIDFADLADQRVVGRGPLRGWRLDRRAVAGLARGLDALHFRVGLPHLFGARRRPDA